MLRFILIGAAISLIIVGAGYIIYYIRRGLNRPQNDVTPQSKKGLWLAIIALLAGIGILYKAFNNKK